MADNTKKKVGEKGQRSNNESASSSLKESSMPFHDDRIWRDRSLEPNNARAARSDQQESSSYADPNLGSSDRASNASGFPRSSQANRAMSSKPLPYSENSSRYSTRLPGPRYPSVLPTEPCQQYGRGAQFELRASRVIPLSAQAEVDLAFEVLGRPDPLLHSNAYARYEDNYRDFLRPRERDREDGFPNGPPPSYSESEALPTFNSRLEMNLNPFQQIHDRDTAPLEYARRPVMLSDQKQPRSGKYVASPSGNTSKTEHSEGPVGSIASSTAFAKPAMVARTPRQINQDFQAEMKRRTEDSLVTMAKLDWQYPKDALYPFRKAMNILLAEIMTRHRLKVGIQAVADLGKVITKRTVALLSPRSKKAEKESESKKGTRTQRVLAREAKNRMRDDPALLGDLSHEDYYKLWKTTTYIMQGQQCILMTSFINSTEWLEIFKADNVRRINEGLDSMYAGDPEEVNKLQEKQIKGPTHKGKAACTICSSKVQPDSDSLRLPCRQRHFFHMDCIKHCPTLDHTCPVCGTKAVEREGSYEQFPVDAAGDSKGDVKGDAPVDAPTLDFD